MGAGVTASERRWQSRVTEMVPIETRWPISRPSTHVELPRAPARYPSILSRFLHRASRQTRHTTVTH